MANPQSISLGDYNQGLQANIINGDVHTEFHITQQATGNKIEEFLAKLKVTDPVHDKSRIERQKGGLLADSYQWVLLHEDFKKWYEEEQSAFLWIKGDPGKGKTMLLCGIINELEKTIEPGHLGYFFIQASDRRLNNAETIIKSLVFQLLRKNKDKSAVIGKVEAMSGGLSQDSNRWQVLCDMLCCILNDPCMKGTCIIIDALDECSFDPGDLLEFIVRLSSSNLAKMLVSSRNWPSIEDALSYANKTPLCLELNPEAISLAVDLYIRYKVEQLSQRKKYKSDTQAFVYQYLTENADSTFLWVALVCRGLQDSNVRNWNTKAKLVEFPAGLDKLYSRMAQQVFQKSSVNANLCREVLAIVGLAFRPLTLSELFSCLPPGFETVEDDPEILKEVVELCGSFLTLKGETTIYFVHQSAKEFLFGQFHGQIFPRGIGEQHLSIAIQSLASMRKILQKNIHNLKICTCATEEITPSSDPLSPVRYSCLFWVNHLEHGIAIEGDTGSSGDGALYEFFEEQFLHWMEALVLLQEVPAGLKALSKLYRLAENGTIHAAPTAATATATCRFKEHQTSVKKIPLEHVIADALRFAWFHKREIESQPLAIYSALSFTPRNSIIRTMHILKGGQRWVKMQPHMGSNWGMRLATAESEDQPCATTFTPDGRYLVCGGYSGTIRFWDIIRYDWDKELGTHNSSVSYLIVSPGGSEIASGYDDGTIGLWCVSTGLGTIIRAHRDEVLSMAYSPDGKYLASGSKHPTVSLWSAKTGNLTMRLRGHTHTVKSVAFSPNGLQVASSSRDGTLRLWCSSNGTCIAVLGPSGFGAVSLTFSSDGLYLYTTEVQTSPRRWNVSEGTSENVIHRDKFDWKSDNFSRDAKQLAIKYNRGWTTIYDLEAQSSESVFLARRETLLDFSPDGSYLSERDNNRVDLWDLTARRPGNLKRYHTGIVCASTFSPDGKKIATGCEDGIINIWDAKMGNHEKALISGCVSSVAVLAFSHDGNWLASGHSGANIELWNVRSGMQKLTFSGHQDRVTSLAFSSDGKQMASGSIDKTARLWDVTSGAMIYSPFACPSYVVAVAISPDNHQLCVGIWMLTIKLFDIRTRQCSTMTASLGRLRSIIFSFDGKRIASESSRGIIIWEAGTCESERRLVTRHGHHASLVRWHELFLPELGRHNIHAIETFAPGRIKSSKYLDISATGSWLMRGSTKLMQLPPEYEPTVFTGFKSTIVIGTAAGEVLIMRFSEDDADYVY